MDAASQIVRYMHDEIIFDMRSHFLVSPSSDKTWGTRFVVRKGGLIQKVDVQKFIEMGYSMDRIAAGLRAILQHFDAEAYVFSMEAWASMVSIPKPGTEPIQPSMDNDRMEVIMTDSRHRNGPVEFSMFHLVRCNGVVTDLIEKMRFKPSGRETRGRLSNLFAPADNVTMQEAMRMASAM